MLSGFTCPELPASKISNSLTATSIAAVSVEELAAPTSDLACAIYSGVLKYFQPLRDDADEQLDFGALQLLDNPEHHEGAINIVNLYHRVKELLLSIGCHWFRLSDLLRPEPRRMILILSAILNFIYYREEKLSAFEAIMEKIPACEERRNELEEKLAELKKQQMDYEAAREMEESMANQVEVEVNKLKQSIQEYNKQQLQIRNQSTELKEKTDAIDDKISQADFELLKKAEENSILSSEVVRSPDRHQRTLEEKRKKLAEVKHSERVLIQNVQEKNATLELYTKAYEKMTKLSSQIQTTQEQINSSKTVEKDLKALKVKLSDDSISSMAIDAKLLELQGKAKQAKDLLTATERECSENQSEHTNKLSNVRDEVDHQLKYLETREKKLEDMVARSDNLHLEADSLREAENLKQQQLLSKLEDVVFAFRSYSNRTSNLLQTFAAETISKHGNNIVHDILPADVTSNNA